MSQDLLPNFDASGAREFLENNKHILFLGNQSETPAKPKKTSEEDNTTALSKIDPHSNKALNISGRYFLHSPILGVSINAKKALEEELNVSYEDTHNNHKYYLYLHNLKNIKKYKDHKSILGLMRSFNELGYLSKENQNILLNQIIETIESNDSFRETLKINDFETLSKFLEYEKDLLKELSNGSSLRQEKFYERLDSLLKRNNGQFSSVNSFLNNQNLRRTNNFLNGLWAFAHLKKDKIEALKESNIKKASDFFLKSIKNNLNINNIQEEKFILETELNTLAEFKKITKHNPNIDTKLSKEYQTYLSKFFQNPQISVNSKKKFLDQISSNSMFDQDKKFLKELKENLFNSILSKSHNPKESVQFSDPIKEFLLSLSAPEKINHPKNFDNAIFVFQKHPSFENSNELLKSYYSQDPKTRTSKEEDLLKSLTKFPVYEKTSMLSEKDFFKQVYEHILNPIIEANDNKIFNSVIESLINNTQEDSAIILSSLTKTIIDFTVKQIKNNSNEKLDKARITQSIELLEQIYDKEDLNHTDELTANNLVKDEVTNLINISNNFLISPNDENKDALNKFSNKYLKHLSSLFGQKNASLHNKEFLLTQFRISLSETQNHVELNKTLNSFKNEMAKSFNIPEDKVKNHAESYILNEKSAIRNILNSSYKEIFIENFQGNTKNISGANKTWQSFFGQIIKEVNKQELDANIIKMIDKFLNSFIDINKLTASEVDQELEILETALSFENTHIRQKAESRFIKNFNELVSSELPVANKILTSFNHLANSKSQAHKDSASFILNPLKKRLQLILEEVEKKLINPPKNPRARLRLRELDELSLNLEKSFKEESLKLFSLLSTNIENTIHQEQEKLSIINKMMNMTEHKDKDKND